MENVRVKDRIKNQKYLLDGKIKRWDGRCFRDVCEDIECLSRPSYGFENGDAERCSKHKIEDMVNVVSRKCEKCKKQPSYGLETDGIKRYCATHKTGEMIDLSNRKCEDKGCGKIPCFGFEKDGIARYCLKHKADNMMDVKHKKCEKCENRPCFGLENDGIVRCCFVHKTEEMIDVRHKKCEDKNCKKQPSFEA
jgi:hypothetical protein